MSKQTPEYNATTSFISRGNAGLWLEINTAGAAFSARLKPVRPENTAAVALRLLLPKGTDEIWRDYRLKDTESHAHEGELGEMTDWRDKALASVR